MRRENNCFGLRVIARESRGMTGCDSIVRRRIFGATAAGPAGMAATTTGPAATRRQDDGGEGRLDFSVNAIILAAKTGRSARK